MRSNNNNNNNGKTEKKHGRPAVDAEGLDLVKAAAWAWYERPHRSTAVKECNPRFFTKKPSHSVYKPSRFRAEASADRKRGGSTKYVDQYNNKAKRHSLDNSRLSRSACTDFAADGRSSRDEAEYLKRSVCNLDDKCSERWDFGKSLLDSYEIVAIFKYVDNYAPFNASLRLGSESRADQEAAPAADTNGNIIANTDGAVADLCLLASEDGRSMCSPTSEMAGVLEIGTAQKQRYLHSIFSLNAFSKRLKSLAHLQFVRLHHRDRRPHQHRHDHRHPCRVQDLNR